MIFLPHLIVTRQLMILSYSCFPDLSIVIFKIKNKAAKGMKIANLGSCFGEYAI